MQNVKLLKPMDYRGTTHAAGATVEVEDDVAKWLIANGGAAAVRPKSRQERNATVIEDIQFKSVNN